MKHFAAILSLMPSLQLLGYNSSHFDVSGASTELTDYASASKVSAINHLWRDRRFFATQLTDGNLFESGIYTNENDYTIGSDKRNIFPCGVAEALITGFEHTVAPTAQDIPCGMRFLGFSNASASSASVNVIRYEYRCAWTRIKDSCSFDGGTLFPSVVSKNTSYINSQICESLKRVCEVNRVDESEPWRDSWKWNPIANYLPNYTKESIQANTNNWSVMYNPSNYFPLVDLSLQNNKYAWYYTPNHCGVKGTRREYEWYSVAGLSWTTKGNKITFHIDSINNYSDVTQGPFEQRDSFDIYASQEMDFTPYVIKFSSGPISPGSPLEHLVPWYRDTVCGIDCYVSTNRWQITSDAGTNGVATIYYHAFNYPVLQAYTNLDCRAITQKSSADNYNAWLMGCFDINTTPWGGGSQKYQPSARYVVPKGENALSWDFFWNNFIGETSEEFTKNRDREPVWLDYFPDHNPDVYDDNCYTSWTLYTYNEDRSKCSFVGYTTNYVDITLELPTRALSVSISPERDIDGAEDESISLDAKVDAFISVEATTDALY